MEKMAKNAEALECHYQVGAVTKTPNKNFLRFN